MDKPKIPEEMWSTPSNKMKTQNSSLSPKYLRYIDGFSLHLNIS